MWFVACSVAARFYQIGWHATLLVLLVTLSFPTIAQDKAPKVDSSTAEKADTQVPDDSAAQKEPVGSAKEPVASPAPRQEPLTPREIYLRTLNSVGFVITDMGTGTAWVWDIDRRLMVTNDHVVAGAKEIVVFFPAHKGDTLQVEPDYYREHVTPVKATVIDSDVAFDLAIIELESLPKKAVALKLADRSAAPGERVHAIGGRPYGSEGLWKYSIGFVSQVANADLSQTGTKIMALQSNIDINPGNSGGPIVNDEGMVVAVAQSILRDAQSVSYGVDVSSIRGYLTKACPLVDGDTAEAKLELANRHRRRGRLETAMKYLNEAIKIDKKSAASHTTRGWTFFEIGDFATAVADFDKAIELDDSDVEAWRGRAAAHRRLGDFEKAYSDISRAIAQDATRADSYNARAIIEENRERFDRALKDYARAISLDSKNPLYLANRADLYLKQQQYDLAKDDLTVALELAPDSAWVQQLMGLVYYRLKKYQEADPYLRRAVELDSSNAGFVADFAENAQAVPDHDQGIARWTRYIELNPKYPYAYFSRAWSLRRRHKLDAALDDLDKAIELAGAESPAFYYQERALVYQDLGKSELAKRDFDKASELDPEKYGANQTPVLEDEPSSSVVGKWYVNQEVEGNVFEMTHEYRKDGTYHGVMNYTSDGEKKKTVETGKYEVGDGVIRFKTNLGDYEQKFKFEDGLFWLFFPDMDYWFGSVRQ